MQPRIELFCEDSAHESFARALTRRLAAEAGIDVTLHVASAQFGIPRMKQELRAFQALVAARGGSPDLLLVLIDANRVGPQRRRAEVEEIVDPAVFPRCAIGTPDPHIERWFLSDATSFAERFGIQPPLTSVSGRSGWKNRLVDTLEQAGEIVMQGGAEFADEIVDVMDLYRAGRTAPTLAAFADDLRAALQQIQISREAHGSEGGAARGA